MDDIDDVGVAAAIQSENGTKIRRPGFILNAFYAAPVKCSWLDHRFMRATFVLFTNTALMNRFVDCSLCNLATAVSTETFPSPVSVFVPLP